MKNYKNYISLIILLILMCGIMVAITQISKSNTLNTSTTPTPDTPSTNNNFDYIPAKESIHKNIEFENTFGGSSNENIYEIFKLNYYYIIGTTTSNDMYFENANKNALFVLVIDTYGNADSVNIFDVDTQFEILGTKIFRNSIYILIEHNGCKLISFDLSSKQFDIEFFDQNPNAELIISDEPIVILKSHNTQAYFCISDKLCIFSICIDNVMMYSEYLNGTLLIVNSQNNIHIGILTQNGLDIIQTITNTQLISITIAENKFVFVTKTNTSNQLLILDTNFDILSQTDIGNGFNYSIIYDNNLIYVIYEYNHNITMKLLCLHGSLINEIVLFENVKEYKTIYSNKTIKIACTSKDNFINIINYNLYGEQQTQLQIIGNSSITIDSFNQESSNSYILCGITNQSSQLGSNSFGLNDIYICKIFF